MKQRANLNVFQEINVDVEMVQCPEALFKPSLMGIKSKGVHKAVFDSLMKCDEDKRNKLFGNIILSGGSTMFPGEYLYVCRCVLA